MPFLPRPARWAASADRNPTDDGAASPASGDHLALRVDDLAATSAALVAAGIEPLNEPMHFIGRNLQFFRGPEGITVELVERLDGT